MSKRKPYEYFTLPNGLEVVLYPMPSVYTSFAVLYVRTGAIYEKEKERGLSHFAEHASLLGTKKHPSAVDLSQRAALIGAAFNAITTRLSVYYWVRMPYTELENGLRFLYEIVFKALLSKEDVEKERSVVLTEYQDFMSVPENRFGYNLWQKRFKEDEHPYTYRAIGLPENVEKFTRQDVLAWQRRFYHPANMVLSVAGNIEIERAKVVIKEVFGKIPGGKKAIEPRFTQGNYSDSLVYHCLEPREQIRFEINFPTFGWRNHPRRQFVVLQLLSRILGGGPDSRLFARVREKERLVYSISSGTTTYPWRGSLFIVGSTSRANIIKSLGVVREEIEKLLGAGIVQGEFTRAKTPVIAGEMMKFDRPEDIAYSLGDDIFNEEKEGIWLPDNFAKAMESISEREVLELAKEVFNFSKVNVGLFGNLSKREVKEVERIFK